jgi:hypothetical protein
MRNITLISTRHEAIGEWTSNVLYQILTTIKPDVIFEEIPPSYHPMYYSERRRRNLESEAVMMYLTINTAANIPVDTDDMPSEDFFRKQQRLIERIEGLIDKDGQQFRSYVDGNKHYTSVYGYRFLNSDYCIQYNDGVTEAIENGLKTINDEALNQQYKEWIEVNDRREHEMLQNIYRYSREHGYSNAVFILGASHRKSIKEKIKIYNVNELPKLNWVIYGEEKKG